MSFGGSVGGSPGGGVSGSTAAFKSPVSTGFQGELQMKQRERGWVGMMLDASKSKSVLGSFTTLGIGGRS